MHRLAQDIMSSSVISVPHNTPCQQAIEILVTHRISGIPVTDDDGSLMGVISMYDFLNASIHFPNKTEHFCKEQLERMMSKGSLDIDSMLDAYVSDFMTMDVITVNALTPLTDIKKLMVDKHIHRVIVQDPVSRKPVGVISAMDMLKLVPELASVD